MKRQLQPVFLLFWCATAAAAAAATFVSQDNEVDNEVNNNYTSDDNEEDNAYDMEDEEEDGDDLLELCRRDATWSQVEEIVSCESVTGWDKYIRNSFWWEGDPLALSHLEGIEDSLQDCLKTKMKSYKIDSCHLDEHWNDAVCQVSDEDEWNHPRVTSWYSHETQGDLVTVANVLTEHEARAVQSLTECVQELLPKDLPFYEEREFGTNKTAETFGMYKQGGGNHVTFLSGLLQYYLPGVTNSLYQAVVQAYEHAGWSQYEFGDSYFPMYQQHLPKFTTTHDDSAGDNDAQRHLRYHVGLPHPTTMGIRTAEYLQYHETGRLGQHSDTNSILTISVALTDADTFEGGYFHLFSDSPLFKVPRLSAMVFFSEASHGITPISSSNSMMMGGESGRGHRTVLVAEFWNSADVPVGLPRPSLEQFATYQTKRLQEIHQFFSDDDYDEEEDDEYEYEYNYEYEYEDEEKQDTAATSTQNPPNLGSRTNTSSSMQVENESDPEAVLLLKEENTAVTNVVMTDDSTRTSVENGGDEL